MITPVIARHRQRRPPESGRIRFTTAMLLAMLRFEQRYTVGLRVGNKVRDAVDSHLTHTLLAAEVLMFVIAAPVMGAIGYVLFAAQAHDALTKPQVIASTSAIVTIVIVVVILVAVLKKSRKENRGSQ